MVAIRFRPQNKKEEASTTPYRLDINPSENSISIAQPGDSERISLHKFVFDRVFDHTASQEEIFDRIAKNAVEWVCQGYNSTIFAYGNTSSGKSFTMFGHESGNEKMKGIIPRACQLLFENINNNPQTEDANLRVSFLEIYRETIRDLIKNSSLAITGALATPGDLKLRQNPTKGVYVEGLREKFVESADEIIETIREGMNQRTVAQTSLNSVSSRSHAVLTLHITQKMKDGSEITSKLNLIDLAGSENVGKSEAQGITLAEAQMINKSLSCLGNVIYALTEKGRDHIPYRDSKLTYLLQDSIGGNSKTILIATASPSPLSYSETINTLKFAQRAKMIKNVPKVNRNEGNDVLLKTIQELRKRITELESKCEDNKAIIQAVETASDDKEKALLRTRADRLEKRLEQLQEKLSKEKERNTQTLELYEKERNLAQDIAKELYEKSVLSNQVSNELDQYRMFYETVKDMAESGNISLEIVKVLLSRTDARK